MIASLGYTETSREGEIPNVINQAGKVKGEVLALQDLVADQN